jgi:hypothetical protein
MNASPQVKVENREKISPLAITIAVPERERSKPIILMPLIRSFPNRDEINMTSTGFNATISDPWLASTRFIPLKKKNYKQKCLYCPIPAIAGIVFY